MFLCIFSEFTYPYLMQTNISAPVKKPLLPARPLWARRLRMAFELSGFTNKKGDIDTRALRERFNVSYKTIESWITGRTEPRFEKLMRVREITGYSLDWIISDDATAKVPQKVRASKRASSAARIFLSSTGITGI